jgi:hypothetical protein
LQQKANKMRAGCLGPAIFYFFFFF